jgi:hypothetical protein
MTPEIDVVAPEDTLTTAAQLMADLDSKPFRSMKITV